ncbi:prepilin-type N-terminal cleavage/methylation domain-containing protein [Microcoleus sp. FACHB-SPT15]|uniref:prepilin-type N-terminal cleavage/methylation domain-containing protein n=1 Tax=Microcoleus sp. FACHB-SPT15 TaxID=2692830 RepID=UPI00177F2230|nr:prepilin-type N-terminal cleavage/methylation domain-containing protein [Microcoleus sp. FACHB-SPT15]MBD1806892.1 prepilin-type N-terminal cleavage/methylation domain-containing protein [Microcoleus sp. FACHB-SPT15]
MENTTLTQTLLQIICRYRLRTDSNRQAGFTFIELLVVIIMIGVLSAIAAPGWLGFVQQRRAGAASDAMVRAMQEAQSLAKTRKLSYSVSFRNEGGVPQVAIYPYKNTTGNEINPNNLDDISWKSLGNEQLALKPGQIILRTNLGTANQGTNAINTIPNGEVKTITFSFLGTLPTDPTPVLNPGGGAQEGLVVEVGAPQGTDGVIPVTRRCAKILTLLGSLQTKKGNQCNLS